MTLIDALWIGPYGYRKAPEGTLLETGITVCQIGEHEAHASDNWQPLTGGQPDTASDVDTTDTGGDD